MKKTISVVIPLLLVFTLLSLFAVHAEAAEKKIKLTLSTFWPAKASNGVVLQKFCDEIKKRTNGRVEITPYWGSSLTPAAENYEGVVKGISDIGACTFNYTPGRFPAFDACNLPFGATSSLEATYVLNDFYEKFRPKEVQDVKVLYLHSFGPYFIFTKGSPVLKLEDFKGRVFRAPGKIASGYIKALGGTPRAMPMGESYEALSKGIVNGMTANMSTLKSWKLAEVLDYGTLSLKLSLSCGPFYTVMNKEKWNSLPADVKKIFEEVSNEWKDRHAKEAWDHPDIEAIDYCRQNGMKFFKLPPAEEKRWKNAVKVVINNYVKEKSAMGLPAAEYVKYIEKRLDYWGKKMESPWFKVFESLPER